jgi:DNA-binding response OmpR family regulator
MEKEKLLIVDDEEDIREILQFNLENEGYIVDTASSGEEALEKLSPEHKLILLDVMMGGISGFHVAERLRKNGIQTPIIFLTARGTENDLLTGFSVGADDYIAKPFSVKEIIARVKAITKRNPVTFPEAKKEADVLESGKIKVNLISKQLNISGKKVDLTKKEFDILCLFMQNPNRVLSRAEILEKVWNGETFVLDRTVDVHIARLRKKLEEYGACITNRPYYGYSFINPIES